MVKNNVKLKIKCRIMLKWKQKKKIVNLLGREKSNEVVDYYPTNSAQETKQTNKQNHLLTLTVPFEKNCCLIRSKKKQ